MEQQEIQSRTKKINFFSENIEAYYFTEVCNFKIKETAIVINIGLAEAEIAEEPIKKIGPMKSAILRNTVISSADALLVVVLKNTVDIGKVILEDHWLSAEK